MPYFITDAHHDSLFILNDQKQLHIDNPEQSPLASEHTARKPSSVSILNKGRTPYVSLPSKTFLLAVSSSTKANTPSSSDAIFSMPKRS